MVGGRHSRPPSFYSLGRRHRRDVVDAGQDGATVPLGVRRQQARRPGEDSGFNAPLTYSKL